MLYPKGERLLAEMGGLIEFSDDDGEQLDPSEDLLVLSEVLLRMILLIELILGTFNFVHLLSLINLSRISQENIVGFSSLYLIIISTTSGTATLGLDPPVEPALYDPVFLYFFNSLLTQPCETFSCLAISQARMLFNDISMICFLTDSGRALPLT